MNNNGGLILLAVVIVILFMVGKCSLSCGGSVSPYEPGLMQNIRDTDIPIKYCPNVSPIIKCGHPRESKQLTAYCHYCENRYQKCLDGCKRDDCLCSTLCGRKRIKCHEKPLTLIQSYLEQHPPS